MDSEEPQAPARLILELGADLTDVTAAEVTRVVS